MRSKFKWIFTLLVALSMQFSFAQEKTVTGVVSDNSGPLPGANVVVKGTTRGAQTDLDGKYSIKTKVGETLVYSFIGLDDQSKTVGAANTISVKLGESKKLLDEVVIQGYRDVSKKSAVTAKASVDSKTLENRPNANVINTLQGQLAGVNITASTGQPGAKSSVVIRGISSFNGNTDPLYVIDGFPSNSDNFRSINPNDIATVDVLKDAAAISEYGSRGTNGVIVIRTKKGSFGDAKTTFRYSTQFGLSQLQNPTYDYANSKELLTLERSFGIGLGNSNPATGLPFTDAEINAFDIETDWVDYFFRTGTSTNHNFSVENNSKNLNSFTSVSYFNQEGILNTTGLKRFTIRNNINGKSNNEKLKYSMNIGYGFSKNNEATNLGGGAINRNYVLGAFISAPYISPTQYQGSQQVFDLYTLDGTLLYTPLFLIDKLATYNNITEESRLNVATRVSYDITKNLTARVQTSAEYLANRFQQSEHPISFNAFLFINPGQTFAGFEDINQRREFLFNNLWGVEYNKSFGKHTFTVTANAEYNHSRLNTNNFRQRGLDPNFFVPNSGTGYIADTGTNDFHVPQISASQLRLDMISYFGSLDYDFNKKYGVVGSIRTDKTSRFLNAQDSFWSVGGRWNIDEEGFMDSVDFVKSLKLRGSFGTVGNQRIVPGTVYAGILPPAFFDVYSNINNSYNNGAGFGFTVGNPDIKWETTEQFNVGIDFELFKSRVRGSLEYYRKRTYDLYVDEPIVPAVGDLDDTLTKNTDANLINKGLEATLFLDVIKTANTTFTLRGNGSYNKQRIEGLVLNGGRLLTAGPPQFITQNGGVLGEAYVYHYIGVNPANGELLFEDINGNVTESPTDADKRATGKSRVPVYQGGFGFDFEHKGFYLSSTFTFAADVWRFDFDLENLYDPTNLGQFTVGSDLLNAWTPTNTNTNVPSLNAGNLAEDDDSDRFLKDASYIRLRNLQMGYRIPKKFLEKTFFKEVGISLQAENIVTFSKWDGFDPESDRNFDVYQYPTPRLYTLGLDLKF